jgi:hypothetical protein
LFTYLSCIVGKGTALYSCTVEGSDFFQWRFLNVNRIEIIDCLFIITVLWISFPSTNKALRNVVCVYSRWFKVLDFNQAFLKTDCSENNKIEDLLL